MTRINKQTGAVTNVVAVWSLFALPHYSKDHHLDRPIQLAVMVLIGVTYQEISILQFRG